MHGVYKNLCTLCILSDVTSVMKHISNELKELIEFYSSPLHAIDEEKLSFKSSPVKWSKKEILGHLIDSALSNSRRFIVAQYEDNPHIVYAQEYWVQASGYQQYEGAALIQLWVLINKHICRILENIPGHLSGRTCMTQDLHTIEWLAEDYVRHLKHHMHVILDVEAMTYP